MSICNVYTACLNGSQIIDFFLSVRADLTPLEPGDSFHVRADCTYRTNEVHHLSGAGTEATGIHQDQEGTRPRWYIPNWVLKDYAGILSAPLCAVFNSSLREGFVNKVWKFANVCPLPSSQSSARECTLYLKFPRRQRAWRGVLQIGSWNSSYRSLTCTSLFLFEAAQLSMHWPSCFINDKMHWTRRG